MLWKPQKVVSKTEQKRDMYLSVSDDSDHRKVKHIIEM